MNRIKTLRRILLSVFFLLLASIAFTQPVFNNKIPIPYIVDSTGPGTKDVLRLVAEQRGHYFDPIDSLVFNPVVDALNGTRAQRNLPPLKRGIPAATYNQVDSSGKNGALTFLGPTLIWRTSGIRNQHIELKDTLYDTQDTSVANASGFPLTTHWHGAEIPSIWDGGPHGVINYNDTWKPIFRNLDGSSTLWYHPHYHDYTVQQVSAGLSGMILSIDASDPIAPLLPHTYGVDDIPLIIGDLGTIKITNGRDLLPSPPPTPRYRCPYGVDSCYTIVDVGEPAGIKRPINLVNGVTNPYVEVPNAMVRLRILNGSTRKGVQFGFSDVYDAKGAIVFTLLATDGGYVVNTDNIADTFHTILTGPGSRNEILLDLTKYHDGDSIYMSNMKESMPGSIVGSPQVVPQLGGGKDTTQGKAFLKLKIFNPAHFPGYTPITTIPQYKSDWDPAVRDTLGINRRREKKLVLTKVFIPNGNGNGLTEKNRFTIDSTEYDLNVINDTICLGAKEMWTIINTTPVAHPFHIHKIFFRVIDIKDSSGNNVDLHTYGLCGPKDDAMILPGWKFRFIAKFDDYPDPIHPKNTYMYHCHILTHEDAVGGGMMHQFVVTDDPNCIPSNFRKLPEMKLFPNPSSGEVFLMGVSNVTSTVNIFDEIGRLIREQQLDPFWGNININIAGIRSGIYFVRWNNAKGSFSEKLIIGR